MRTFLAAIPVLVNLGGRAWAHDVDAAPPAKVVDPAAGAPEAASAEPPTIEGGEPAWSVSLTASFYIVPDDRDYLQPTITADYDRLHLEARFNYEDLDTASVWAGYNLAFGDEITLDVTPMVGGVFGDTDGVALGYEFTLTIGRIELYSEGEYLIDLHESSSNFFYTWSELSYSLTDWLRAGAVWQRTRIRDQDSEVDWGLLAGVSVQNIDFTTYVFGLTDDTPTVVLALTLNF